MKALNSSSPGDAYSRHCSRQLLKTLWPKEILLKLSNISFGNNVFNIIWQIYLSVFRSFRFLLICLKSRLLQICFRCWRVNEANKILYLPYIFQTQAWMDVFRFYSYTTKPFITPLLGSKAQTMLVEQACYIQTKMYRLYRKMTIYGHFSI